MISEMDKQIQENIAEEADPYRVDIKALSGEVDSSYDLDEDVINDEFTSV